MRLRITIKPIKNKAMNINYNYYLSSLCYSFLNKGNKNFAKMLHEEGFEASGKKFKLFTFSQLFCERYKIDGTYVTFLDCVNWYVSSPINEFILYFAQALLNEEKINIGGVEFLVENVEVLEQIKLKERTIFKSLSPIVVNSGEIINGEFKQIFLSIDNEKFKENLKNNLIKKYFALYKSLPKNLNLDINMLDKDKYKRGKRINIKNSFIKGYMATFEVSGSEELILMGYDAGYGSKNSMGCGMVEIINTY
ncbi:CRISPR-associated protein Cas6 [Fervidicella metallireducens AeB]|uniref:CRISPR-associated endoribonuclease n=1 Tax=Fervidicella metallireducens AeB TaxID=1403537 RepID=A0A017RXS4_9CLOT|nr:CRISPR-associated endoribonuclease Cas6 [Fervidicella metallireducens]EYE89391.1 CRISPR-associated protein Cas6 [Fervidicella metallireducens AeB]